MLSSDRVGRMKKSCPTGARARSNSAPTKVGSGLVLPARSAGLKRRTMLSASRENRSAAKLSSSIATSATVGSSVPDPDRHDRVLAALQTLVLDDAALQRDVL